MVKEDRSRKPVSVLGHPVAGLAPVTFLSAGWILLTLRVLPRLRDQADVILSDGRWPIPSGLWPPAPDLALLALIAAGLLLAGLVLFLTWVGSAGGLGPLADRLLRRSELLAAVVLLAAGVLSVSVIARGDPTLLAAKTHIARGWLWHEYIRAGTYPLWTDLWYGGFPGAQHSPPLAHLLQSLIAFLRFDAFTAAKVLTWFCRMAGAIGFALLCARIHLDQRAGLLGGVIYALAPSFHAAWVWEGHLPGAVVLAILPFALYASDRLATGAGGFRSGASLAMCSGAITMTDTELARLSFALIGLFILVRAIPTITRRGARAPSVTGVLIGVLGGAALSTAYILPVIFDSHLLNQVLPASLSSFAYRFPDLAAIDESLRWSAIGGSYIGISVALLAIGGLVRSLVDKKEEGHGIGPVPLVLLIIAAWFLSSVWGQGSTLMFLGVQMAAAGFVRRAKIARFRWVPRKGLLALALLLVLVDFAPINLFTTYDAAGKEKERIYTLLQDRLPSGRFLELPVDSEGRTRSSSSLYAPTVSVSSVGGPFIQAAPREFSFQAAMIDTLASALADNDTLSSDLVDLLALHNIRYVVVSSREGPVEPPDPGNDEVVIDPEIPALRIENAAPASILDPGLPAGGPPELPAMAVSGLSASASHELIEYQLEWIRAARPRMVHAARAVALPNRLEVELPDVGPAMIRLARNAYPSTEVLVDGKTWPWEAGPLGGIVVMVEEGPHKIQVWGKERYPRRYFRLGQWILFGLLFLVALGPYRR